MPRTLYYGSMGPEVRQLQQGLNRLPTRLPSLVPDGQFGNKTRSRTLEFQSSNKIAADGVVGPMTWDLLLKLLQQVAQGGVPTIPDMPAGVLDFVRPLVLVIAQQQIGKVDFSQYVNNRPLGVDFLIELFRVAANVQLTDANFRNKGTGDWNWEPWINDQDKNKSWCGVFAVYCYQKAGIPVTWDFFRGCPSVPMKLSAFSASFAAGIKPADIGCVASKSHHFLIESVNGSGLKPSLTTIDGNTEWGRIQRRNTHQVGLDQFNYYKYAR